MIVLAVIVLLGGVALAIGYPLLRGTEAREYSSERVDALELRKQAKYQEIRDAEMDFRMKKLSEPDYRELDRSLRREALGILQEIDDARARRSMSAL